VAFDEEEALHSPAHRVIVHMPVLSDDAIPVGLLDISMEALDQVLFAGRMEDGLRRVGVQDLVHLNLQDLTSHVHSRNLHMVVGSVDGREVLFNLGL